ncbi:amidinotransferase [Candidatus Parcubacteria bacterium]|nr:amidinotransferase [Candidatus Parcubacteria bacterium]
MPKRFLMCPTTYFDIEYEINPWMHTDNRVDQALALHQWRQIHDTYERIGHIVETLDPVKGLPDLIFTANAALVIDGKVMLSRFRYPERQGETRYNQAWFESNAKRLGITEIRLAEHNFEGEGDALFTGDTIIAGYGFRSEQPAHRELADFFNIKVISVKLVDPYFYHLDTCFSPLSPEAAMFLPNAFDAEGVAAIKKHFKTLIETTPREAAAYGLNAVSDGHNVVMSNMAPTLAKQLKDHGFNPITTPITEFHKSGGAVRCVTLEIRT